MNQNKHGFTIVELLVVIVIVGVLAAIIAVSYIGITKKATEASLTSDLNNSKRQLELFKVENENYPSTIDCTKTDSNTNKCIKFSNNNVVDYEVDNTANDNKFFLAISNGTSRFYITNDSAPLAMNGTVCKAGFIKVPGNTTYNTSDFCVMKYEAKNDGNNKPISIPANKPWVDIDQQTAISKSMNTANCSGCHLITEREWMTIAYNVLSVKENWSTNNVGDGYIYNGHNDAAPLGSLEAITDDNGYHDTGQTTGRQKRTLKLTNGETIWDIAGNVWEWTSGRTTSGQPGITNAGYAWRDWVELTNQGTLSPEISPKSTKLANSQYWNLDYGIGQIYSSSEESALKGIMRGGDWGYANASGVLSMYLGDTLESTGWHKGFRVAAP